MYVINHCAHRLIRSDSGTVLFTAHAHCWTPRLHLVHTRMPRACTAPGPRTPSTFCLPLPHHRAPATRHTACPCTHSFHALHTRTHHCCLPCHHCTCTLPRLPHTLPATAHLPATTCIYHTALHYTYLTHTCLPLSFLTWVEKDGY